MKKSLLPIFLILLSLVNSVFADSVLKGIQFGAGISGTTGINSFVGYSNKDSDSFLLKRLGFRLDFAKMPDTDINIDVKFSDNLGDIVKIGNSKVSSHHFGGFVDIYPFGNIWFLGGLKLTTGYLSGNFNSSSVLKNSNNTSIQEFVIDGNKYKYDTSDIFGKAQINWNFSGLYLGGGFDLGLFYGLKIFFDLGTVLVNSSPILDLDIPINGSLKYFDNGTNTWVSVNTPPLISILNNSKNKTIRKSNESLQKFKAFPVVKIGLMYRF